MRASKPGSMTGALTAPMMTRRSAIAAARCEVGTNSRPQDAGSGSARADRPQPQVGVVLERLEDRSLRLRQRARRSLGGRGERPAECADEELVRLLAER